MTQKVTHHNKNHNVINIKIGDVKKKRKRNKNKKRHHLIQQAHLPPFTSVIPNPVSSQINRPYYIETGSIHPLMQESKAKSVDVIKDLVQPPALPSSSAPLALPAPEDQELKNNLHTEFKKLQSHFTDQYHEQYNDPPTFDDQEKQTRHQGIKKLKGEIREDGVRDAPNPTGLSEKEYNKELTKLQQRVRYGMKPSVKENREKRAAKKEAKVQEKEEKAKVKKATGSKLDK